MGDRKEYYKKYYREHRDKELAWDKQYYEKHRDKKLAYGKQWRETHKDEIRAHKRQYYKTHRNELLAYTKLYYEQNKDKKNQQVRAWQKNHRGQYREIKRKGKFKRRSLGFVPLNEPFEGSEAHHIDKEKVIYIPKEYHQSVRHNVWTGKNMVLINNLAYDYLLETKIAEAQERR